MFRHLLALPVLFASSSALAQSSSPVDDIAAVRNATADFLEPLFEQYAPWLLLDVVGTELWRLVALVVTLGLFMSLRRGVVAATLGILRHFTRKTETEIDDQLVEAINPPLGWWVISTGIYLSLFWPNFSPAVDATLDVTYRVTLVVLVGWVLLRSVHILTDVLATLAARTESELDDHLVPLVGRILRVLVFALIVVFAMHELGFNVAGLLAGLGVGGLAFALAAQQTVANWFGALMIYTDRPFKVGDWIKTPDLEGFVEDIGLRSTRVRTFNKTLVSIPNSAIASATIENVSERPIRRVSFKLAVTYKTTPAMMRALLKRIRTIITEHPGVDQAYHLVRFDEFAPSSLGIMIYYFTVSTAWDTHLAVREEVNLMIMDAMKELGVEHALPGRSVYMQEIDEEQLARLDARAREALAQASTPAPVPADA